MEEEKIFYTIKELYDWAIKNGYENYNVFTNDEGCLWMIRKKGLSYKTLDK